MSRPWEMTVTFMAGFFVFLLWLALRRWDLLAAFDIGIIAAQAALPLLSLMLCAVAVMRPLSSLPVSVARLALNVLLGYPIWIVSWWLSMFAVGMLVERGASAELLNNSQAFVSSFVGETIPPISIAGAMGVVAWIIKRRLREPMQATEQR